MSLSTLMLLYGIFALALITVIALFMERTKGLSFGRIKICWGTVVTVFSCLQFTVLYLYLFDYLMNLSAVLVYFLIGWFILAAVGCVVSFFLFIRRQLLPLAVAILLMSYLMIALGLLMGYFNTM